MGTKLYVGNLSFNTMDTDLKTLFQQAGTVVSCDLILDKFTGKSRGFAFVEMSSQEEATKAIADFNGKDLDGRALTVNEAKPREERPRGNFGGGHAERVEGLLLFRLRGNAGSRALLAAAARHHPYRHRRQHGAHDPIFHIILSTERR